MLNGVVEIRFTIGFGNNLFQYCFGRLLSEIHGLKLIHHAIPEMGIREKKANDIPSLPIMIVNDANYKEIFYSQIPNCNIIVNGYFEDYELYKPFLSKIRKWFPRVEKTNNKDLILHMRLQNRLVQLNHHKNHVLFDAYERGVEHFKFKKLYIVTDAKKWDFHTKEDIEEIQYEIRIGPNPTPAWVSTKVSIDYINKLIDGFSKYDPIVKCNGASVLQGSGGLRGNFLYDFNLIRSFDKIMFNNSTFSWWAAVLSDATRVSPFRPWKPAKNNCRNLGRTDYPGWFGWGLKEDLYYEKL
jgi:hypothetical protein